MRAGYRACILIPTYDNGSTLADVVGRACATGLDVLVVDDGSTDDSPEILDGLPGVTVLRHPSNRGKGAALKTGFASAAERGFSHAITLDADGQHLPEDVPSLLDASRAAPAALIVGARDLVAAGAGKGSRFGCRVSNFWTWVETSQRVADTQSGFRVYPLHVVQELYLPSDGFAFEVEVLVRASWTGVALLSVPVRVHYPPPAERVSHFRPIRDFALIGLLNTHLCTVRICLPAPYLALRSQRRYHDLRFLDRVRASVRSVLREGHGSPLRIASSAALGLFLGLTPFWGFQIPLTLALSHLLGASKTIAVAAANISFPLLIPGILYASLVLGRVLLGGGDSASVATTDLEGSDFVRWIVGSFALATLVAAAGFVITLLAVVGGKRSLRSWKKAW